MRALNYSILILFASSLHYACAKKENGDGELSSISQVVATENELPVCIAENTSQVYYVQTENKFMVCNGSSFVEVKGESGAKGEKGEKGESGAKGETGSPANSGVWVYDGNGKGLGVVIDLTQGLLLFSNGGMMRINLKTGAYIEPYAISSTGGLTAALCSYAQLGCAGTCYQSTTAVMPTERPIKGAVYKSGSGYFIVTGLETAQNYVIKSYDTGSGCSDIPDTADSAYPITRIYSFPDGITLPLVTPLSFGFKSED